MLTKKQMVGIVSEGTAGTPESPSGANLVYHDGVVTFEPDIPMVEREAGGSSLSKYASVTGGPRLARMRFKQHIRGTLTAPVYTGVVTTDVVPDILRPLRACGVGHAVSGTTPNEQTLFKPDTALISNEISGCYSTIALFQDGLKYQITGAVGNAVITFNNAQPVMIEYEFQGAYTGPSAVVMPTPSNQSYPAIVEPPFRRAAVSLISSFTEVKLGSLRLDLGNVIGIRPYPNDQNDTGIFTMQITDRRPRGSFDMEATPLGTYNPRSIANAGTVGVIDTGIFPSNGTNYNQIQFRVPAARYTNVVPIDRDGMHGWQVDYEATKVATAGNDEFELIIT